MAFRHRGVYNPNGGGIAFYPDKAAVVIKEPSSAVSSRLFGFLEEHWEVVTKVLVAHVRLPARGL